MLQQSRHVELMGRDGPLDAHKIIRQVFLKVVQKVSEIHARIRSSKRLCQQWSAGVLEQWSIGFWNHHSITPVPRSSKPATCANALCVKTLAMRLRYQ